MGFRVVFVISQLLAIPFGVAAVLFGVWLGAKLGGWN